VPTIVEGGEELIANWREENPAGIVMNSPPASEWPFIHPLCPQLPDAPVLLRAANADTAFVNAQGGGTQLVTTQRKYLVEEWKRTLTPRNATLLLIAGVEDAISHPLALAFRVEDPKVRLAHCVELLKSGRSPAALVATASACMEVNDYTSAARDLDDAIAQAPEWAAAHFERGKLWLRTDDMVKAGESFQRAADLLPGFTSSWANLGATLGELDRPQEALAAFERALALEPSNPQALNNIGVVRRELGRLADSEAAFRRVIELTPEMAFGHYNLGHTLFLQGRFQAALSAYCEGQARDRDRNPVQASRLALCKVATGDAAGALRELQRSTTGLPREYRQQLLGDASAILWALVTQHPTMQGWQPVHEWLAKELQV
jgi:tetratricopeptide (TPR) repeat protein